MISEPNDPLLTLVGTIPGSTGALARAFLERDPGQESEWLDEWFLGLVEEFFQDSERASKPSAETELREEDLARLTGRPASKRVRILSIHPKHFRGFRNCPNPVDLRGDLVVIEGRNSTGKTSLSEAMEWLITGVLSRRASGDLGHPRESADCISNAFRPHDEETSVTARLEVDSKEITLERVLITDYSELAKSLPESRFRLGGQDLPRAEELALQEELFGGIPPILLQQTLRQFIHAQPADRRRYFESLLQIDEITALIEKAVVGDARLKDFPSPSGSRSVEEIREYRNSLGATPASLTLKKVDASSPEDASGLLEMGLIEVARESFSQLVESQEGFEACRKSISDAQAKKREAKLPFLGSLRAVAGASQPHLETTKKASADLIAASARFSTARNAAKTIDESKLAIASAFQELVRAGLVRSDIEGPQVCPICEAFEPSLASARVTELGMSFPTSMTHL